MSMKECSLIRKFAFVSMLLCLFSISTDVFAERQEPNEQTDFFEIPLEQLMEIRIDTVYGASKYEQKVTEAPSSVTIITADEISKYGYRTMSDILRSVRGFYTTYDRNYHYVGVRGFGRPGDYNTRILLLIDGHRDNENIADSASLGAEFPVDVDLIDRVEIIRGPGSSLYGSNALFAVVNVITKGGEKFKGFELSSEMARWETGKSRITYGNLFDNGLNLLVSGTTSDSEGQKLYFKEFDDPATNNGYVRNDDDKFYSFFIKSSFQDFSLTAAHVQREKGIPTASWDTVFGDSRTRTFDDITFIGLTYEHDFSDKFSVMGRLAYNHYNYDGRYVYDYGYTVINKEYWKGRWWESELKFTAQPFEKHKLTWGAEHRYNVRQDQANWDEDVYLDDQRHYSKNWGIYVQDEFKALDNLTFSAGVRHDYYDTFGGSTNPRLALIYNPSKTTVVKLLYGQAFRAPSAYELYYHDGGYTTKPSLDLKPETVKTYEVVLEQYLGQHLRGTITGFYYSMENLIDQYTDPTDGMLVFKNLDKVKAKGVEVELESKWDNGLRNRVSYSFVQTENQKTGKILANSPEHLAKVNLIVPVVKDKLFAGIETQYTSRAKTLGGHYADDFILANLTLTFVNVTKGLEVSASVYNLFDERYGNPGFGEHLQDVITQDGRSFAVKLTYRF